MVGMALPVQSPWDSRWPTYYAKMKEAGPSGPSGARAYAMRDSQFSAILPSRC